MKTIELATETGRIIHFEVADEILSVAVPRAGGQVAGGGTIEARIKQLKDVGETIADVCKTIQNQIKATLDKTKPSELTLEFSVTLAGEKGIPLVTKGSVEGTFRVTAKWDFKEGGQNV